MRSSSTPSAPAPRAANRGGEAGSAYLIALLGLVVLSVMALSVLTVTTTEMEVGANERSVTRAFYAAESGLAVGLANADVNNCEPATFLLASGTDTSEGGTVSTTGFRVETSPPVYVNPFNSNLSSVNENKPEYFNVAYVLNSTATELRWGGDDVAPAAEADDVRTKAQKLIGRTVTFDPHDEPEYKCNDQPDLISKIKT